jgi:hypothetical protein
VNVAGCPARVLWVAAAAPARGAALQAAGFDLLHLDAHAGSADWVRSLVHDALVVEAASPAQAAALIAALRAATPAPLLLLGRPADEALQSLFYELGVDDQLDAGVGAPLLATRLAALFRRWGTQAARCPPRSAAAVSRARGTCR